MCAVMHVEEQVGCMQFSWLALWEETERKVARQLLASSCFPSTAWPCALLHMITSAFCKERKTCRRHKLHGKPVVMQYYPLLFLPSMDKQIHTVLSLFLPKLLPWDNPWTNSVAERFKQELDNLTLSVLSTERCTRSWDSLQFKRARMHQAAS